MDTSVYLQLKQDIECGRYQCLRGCCDPTALSEIWRLMRVVGQTDLDNLSRMLCGCAVSTGNPNPKDGVVVPQGGNQGGTTPLAGRAVSCADKAIEWACAHRDGLTTTRNVLVGAGAAVAIMAPVFGAYALCLTDILNCCTEEGQRLSRDSKVMNQIVARLCTLKASLAAASALPLDGVASAALAAFSTVVTPLLDLMGSCCSGFTAVADNWPPMPSIEEVKQSDGPPRTGVVTTSTAGLAPIVAVPGVTTSAYPTY